MNNTPFRRPLPPNPSALHKNGSVRPGFDSAELAGQRSRRSPAEASPLALGRPRTSRPRVPWTDSRAGGMETRRLVMLPKRPIRDQGQVGKKLYSVRRLAT